MNGTTENPDLIKAAFEQLMQNVRSQDELVHSWTKFYLSIQAALAIALSFLMNPNPSHIALANIGSIVIPLFGIATSICITIIIWREQRWQGRYIMQIRRLKHMPETFRQEWAPSDSDPAKLSYLGKQYLWLLCFVVAGWIVWGIIAQC